MRDVLVLGYHAVSQRWNAALSVTPEALEAQLTTLVARGWKGATFTEAVLRPPHPRTLAVTFDDGYLSVLEAAQEILGGLGLIGTVFVPTAFMDQRQTLHWPGVQQWEDTPYAHELQSMNWDDLRSLAALGWEVGSHTLTHPRLTHLDPQAAHVQLLESRLECSDRMGRPCTSLAYPYGDTDARIVDAAGRAGYLAAAALSRSLAARGHLRWPRLGVYHRDRGWRFRLKVNTGTRWIRASRLWPAQG